MAESSALLAELKDITECPICMDSLTEPKVLPCIHTFCLKCLLLTYGQDKEPGDVVPCPLCRTTFSIPLQGGFEKLPNNYFIKKLLQLSTLSVSDTKLEPCACGFCAAADEVSSASAYCLDCGQYMCELCSKKHSAAKMNKSHQIKKLENKESMDDLLKMSATYCDQHSDQQINLYCIDCKEITCVICYVSKHNTNKCS